MSLCIRCSTSNPPNSARCSQCGAILPRVAGEENQASALFALEDGRVYPTPTESFDTENIAQLRMAVEDYLGGGEPDQVHFWLKHLRKHFQEFSTTGLDGLHRALEVERELNADGDFHHNVGYLMHKGLLLCDSGLTSLEKAMESDDDPALELGFDEFRQGNDHVCTALLMMAERQDQLDHALERVVPVDGE